MDGIGALVRLAAQLDVDALLGFFVFMALRLGGLDCGQARGGGGSGRSQTRVAGVETQGEKVRERETLVSY